MSGRLDQALDDLYTERRADRMAHQARITSELHSVAAGLTDALLPPEMRAAGLRLAYDTKEML